MNLREAAEHTSDWCDTCQQSDCPHCDDLEDIITQLEDCASRKDCPQKMRDLIGVPNKFYICFGPNHYMHSLGTQNKWSIHRCNATLFTYEEATRIREALAVIVGSSVRLVKEENDTFTNPIN